MRAGASLSEEGHSPALVPRSTVVVAFCFSSVLNVSLCFPLFHLWKRSSGVVFIGNFPAEFAYGKKKGRQGVFEFLENFRPDLYAFEFSLRNECPALLGLFRIPRFFAENDMLIKASFPFKS